MRDFLELTKPRITVILVCTAAGYFFGCRTSFRLLMWVHVLLGTALIGCSTGEQVHRNGESGAFRSAQARSGRAAKPPVCGLECFYFYV